MTKEDLFRSMGAIDEDILLRSENAGKNHVEREVSGKKAKGSGKKNRDLFLFGRWVAVAAVLCVGILIGIIGKNIWIEKNRHQKEPTVTPTVTPDVTPTPKLKPSVTPTPDVTPTGEPTPTPSLTPTPTPVLSDEAIDYGDISRFVGKPANEVIAEIGKNYRYEYWGKNREDGLTGGMTFDGKVYFAFTNSKETLPEACVVRMVDLGNSGQEAPYIDLGQGLYSRMSYSEIRNIAQDWFSGPVVNSDGTKYQVYGYFQGSDYCFTWSQSPVNNNLPAESVVLCDDLSYIVDTHMLRNTITEYTKAHTTLMNSHKEQYLKELRASFKDVPVTKYSLLATVQVDDYNVVEIYEIAAYGCGASYKATNAGFNDDNVPFAYTGTDKSKEAYDYYLAGCLISDGNFIGTYQEDDYLGVGFGGLCRTFSRTGNYIFETETLARLIGIPIDKANHLVSRAETQRKVDEEDYEFSINVGALYMDNNSTPVFTEDMICYIGNDGGIFDNHLYVLNEARDKTFKCKQTRTGAYTMDGMDATWRLFEGDSGIKMVTVEVYDEWGSSHYREYLIVNDIWILYREGWEA